MRFLDHIPTKKVIMEAGIGDVGVVLGRLYDEIKKLQVFVTPPNRRLGGEDGMTDKDYLDGTIEDIQAIQNYIMSNLSGDYAKAMWCAKYIRALAIAKINDIMSGQLSPEWSKYATKVMRNTTSFVSYDSRLRIPAALTSISHFVDLARTSPEVARVSWIDPETKKDKPVNQLMSELTHAEQAWQEAMEEKKKSIPLNDKDQVLISDEDMGLPGWFWVYLERSHCPVEAKSMGHCGSENGSHLISLRQVTDYDESGKPAAWRPWATASYLPKQQIIGQLKGPRNTKPAIDQEGMSPEVLKRNRIVRKAIYFLMQWAGVQGFRSGGYGANSDFRPDDLDDEDYQNLPSDKHGLFSHSISAWMRRYGNSAESIIKYFEHTTTPIPQEKLNSLEPNIRSRIVQNAKPEALSHINFQSFVEAYGTKPEAVERYCLSHHNKMLPVDVAMLFDVGLEYTADALKACWELSPTSMNLPQFLVLRKHLGNDDRQEGTIAYFKRSPNYIDSREFQKYPEDVQRVIITHAPTDAIVSLPLSAFIEYLGQTAEMVDRYAKSHISAYNQSIAPVIKYFKGKALAYAWQKYPKEFVLYDYLRLKGYKIGGRLDGTGPKLIAAFVKKRGKDITADDFEGLKMLSREDLRAYMEDEDGDVQDHLSVDLFFIAYGLSDDSIEKFLQTFKPNNFTGRVAYEEIHDEDTTIAIMKYLIEKDPEAAAEAVSMTWEPSIGPNGLYVYEKFKELGECIDRCKDKDKRNNGIDYAVKVFTGDTWYGEWADYHWHDDEDSFEAVLKYKELPALITYAKQMFPEEFAEHEEENGEIESWKEAVEFLKAQGDSIVQNARDAAADGDRYGAEKEFYEDFHEAIDNNTLSLAGVRLSLYFQAKDGWTTESVYDTPCVVGFEPKDFIKLVTTAKDLSEVLKDLYDQNYSYEDGFYMDSSTDHSGFDHDAARDAFFSNCPQEFEEILKPIKAEAEAKKQEKQGVKEGLLKRLAW